METLRQTLKIPLNTNTQYSRPVRCLCLALLVCGGAVPGIAVAPALIGTAEGCEALFFSSVQSNV